MADGRWQPGRLLLVSVLILAFTVTTGRLVHEVDGTSAPSTTARTSEVPIEAPSTPAPLATTQPEAEPATDPPATMHPTVTDPAAMPASAPVRVQISSIGLDSELMDLGLQADGTLEVPPDGFPAGWYTGAPTPGELGPAIIAGHVDWGGQPGVFFHLGEASIGDEVAVTRQNGSTARFRITGIEQYDKDTFPTQKVYGDLDHAGLRLITCDGRFDPRLRSYEDNLVVFAELLGSDPVRAADPDHP